MKRMKGHPGLGWLSFSGGKPGRTVGVAVTEGVLGAGAALVADPAGLGELLGKAERRSAAGVGGPVDGLGVGSTVKVMLPMMGCPSWDTTR